MLLSNIDDLLDETATKSGFSKEIVADVIKHFFSYMRNFLLNPTHIGLRITFLGVIRPDKRSLNFYLRKKIKHLRNNYTEENVALFKKYWALRRLLQKDLDRRNYKKRYGKWHFK